MAQLEFEMAADDCSVRLRNHSAGGMKLGALRRQRRERRAGALPPPASIGAAAAATALRAAQPCTPSSTGSSSGSGTCSGSDAAAQLVTVPVGVVEGSDRKQYAWNGQRLVAVEPEELAGALGGGQQQQRVRGLQGALQRLAHDLHAAFFPSPREVTPDYWEYVKFRAGHRLFSSMASIFATQSLLQAVGVGARHSLTAAATINWVLKDGLGRLGRLTVATRFGESFDSDLKRFRYTTSMLYAVALSLEYMTPLFPQHFLALASAANIGKSIGLTTFIATQPAFSRSFCLSENLADISAKLQAQQMVMDNIGLATAVTLTHLVRHSDAARRALPLVVFPFLAAGDLYSIYRELRSIHLRTLNKERAEIIAQHWLTEGAVPSPREVSGEERLILPPHLMAGPLPLTIASLDETVCSPADLSRLQRQQAPPAHSPRRQQRGDEQQQVQAQQQRWPRLGGGACGGQQQRHGVGKGGPRADGSPTDRYFITYTPPSWPGSSDGSNSSSSSSGGGGGGGLRGAAAAARRATAALVPAPLRRAAGAGSLRVALRSDAGPEDIVTAVLQAAYLRQALGVPPQTRASAAAAAAAGAGLGGPPPVPAAVAAAAAAADPEAALAASAAAAGAGLAPLLAGLRAAGWQVEPFMLSSTEKRCFVPM